MPSQRRYLVKAVCISSFVVGACYLKRRQTIANSTVAMIAVPAKKAQWKLNSRITTNSAGPGVCFPFKIDARFDRADRSVFVFFAVDRFEVVCQSE
jgi:hypothetical protein